MRALAYAGFVALVAAGAYHGTDYEWMRDGLLKTVAAGRNIARNNFWDLLELVKGLFFVLASVDWYYSVSLFLFGYTVLYMLGCFSPRRSPSRPPRNARRAWARGTGDELPCFDPATGLRLEKRFEQQSYGYSYGGGPSGTVEPPYGIPHCDVPDYDDTVRVYTEKDVKSAINRARVAQKDYEKHASIAERGALLMDVLDWVVGHKDVVLALSVRDSGKTLLESALADLIAVLEKIRGIVNYGPQALKPTYRSPPALLMNKSARVEYCPIGVIGIIVPWNYPVQNVLSHAVTALYTGNACVIKVSEHSSYSAQYLEQVLRNIVAARGHDPELVQVITGYGETGAVLTTNVDKVLFIGSPQVGKLVQKQASAALVPCILELGGKDPFIVFDDCDYNHTRSVAETAIFFNMGQNCVSAERIFVQRGVYDRFVADMKTLLTQRLRQGCSSTDMTAVKCDVGCLTMPAQVKIISELVDDAVRNGAKLVVGGTRNKDPVGVLSPAQKQHYLKVADDIAAASPAPSVVKSSAASPATPVKTASAVTSAAPVFYKPTLLCDVTTSMRIAREEVFGPVCTVIPFDTEDEVIEMANGTRYGLGCSIMTRDYAKAERVAARMQCGMVHVNDFGVVPLMWLPFGGIKDSGYGRFNGEEGLREFTHLKAVVTDRLPIRMAYPSFLQYPIKANAHLIVQRAVDMIYGASYWTSALSLVRMLQLIFIEVEHDHDHTPL